MTDWPLIPSPFLDRGADTAVRDPALFFDDGVFRCFHTVLEQRFGEFGLFIDLTESVDLISWTQPWRVLASEENLCSPGNVLAVDGRWVMCFNSYPVAPGDYRGGGDARLWLAESDDLLHWENARPLLPTGSRALWATSPQQMDPFLIAHGNRYWCLYKSGADLGLLVSEDLQHWQDVSYDRPVFGRYDTPDVVGIDNPSVVFDGSEFVLFYSPCRPERGIGVARSKSLVRWRHERYLDLPAPSWAPAGVSGASVLDARATHGKWLMAFHGEQKRNLHTALGLAWSDDLVHWEWS